jgi:hypothetical protein
MEFNLHTSIATLELAVYITHKVYRHDATEILLKMALNTIALTLLMTT